MRLNKAFTEMHSHIKIADISFRYIGNCPVESIWPVLPYLGTMGYAWDVAEHD